MATAIRGALFDLDDTLLDGVTAWRSGIAGMLARCPDTFVPADVAFDAWDAAFKEHHPRYLAGTLTYPESQVARIRSWAAGLAITVPPGDEQAWFGDFLKGYEAGWSAFADAAPCLDSLAGLQLGVITNGDSRLQRAKLAAIGLADRFDVVLAAGDVGYAKPDARIFRLAADLLGLSVDECLYIGDQRQSDALGALEAGMQGVWLNRTAALAVDDRVSEIGSLVELKALL